MLQYSRRKCLDVIDIPSEVDADGLEEKSTSAWLWYSKNGNIVSNFWKIKRDLQKVKKKDVNFPGQNKRFIDKMLCPYYKVL